MSDSANINEILRLVRSQQEYIEAIPKMAEYLHELNENVKVLIGLYAKGGGADLAAALQKLTEAVQNMSSEVSDLKNVIRSKP